MELDERKKLILASIIKDYVETAEPVGSRAIVKKYAMNISAATVRNEMYDLEEMGYLYQLHTSSGRIPSEQGFRYFVDNMMEKESIDDEELQTLQEILKGQMHEWVNVVEKVGNFLSVITNHAAFIILPPFSLSEFKHMEILPYSPGKAVVFLISDMGLIMHRKIDIHETIGNNDLNDIAALFNKVFRRKRISDVSRSDLQQLKDNLRKKHKAIEKALEALEIMLSDSQEEKVLLSGALNMLSEPEFKDLEKLKRILTMFGEEGFIKNVVPSNPDTEASIMIGSENLLDDMKDLALVYAGYNNNNVIGKIGLLGPIRMSYGKSAGAVESIRELLEDIVKKY